jgi:sulfofructosephosphate aldolase
VVSVAQPRHAPVTLDAIARPGGTFLMVAMDQRESLRTMIAERTRKPVPDERLVAFKLAVARELAPLASGFLIDRRYGFDEVARRCLLPASCGLILAADALVQAAGEPVEDTELDTEVDAAAARAAGTVALKLLVVWRDDDRRAHRAETAHRFVDLARSQGLLSVLEPVVRGGPGFDREVAIVEAAAELGQSGCDLYKCEVPTHGQGEPAEITGWCRRLDAVLPCPWVVLSQGVDRERFPAAIEAACRGGASGMLAGRAIWSDVAGADDPAPLLRERSVPRLERLADIVDTHGVPWHQRGVTGG